MEVNVEKVVSEYVVRMRLKLGAFVSLRLAACPSGLKIQS